MSPGKPPARGQIEPAVAAPKATWPSLKLAAWPEADRATWLANTVRGRRHHRPKPANRYADESLANFAKGYARWLGFLHHRGCLDTTMLPGERVTPDRLAAYFHALQAAGNADETVVGRFRALSYALALLDPTQDWRWVRGPDGNSVIPRRLRTRRTLVVPHSRVLYRWGCQVMDQADAAATPITRALQFRDGLIIALEAARARRLRSMAGLQLGTELLRQHDGHWRITLAASRVKTRKADSFALPAELTPCIDRYLAEFRPILLQGRDSQAVWIATGGRDLSPKSYGENYGLRAKSRFGIRFGPHRNRHAAATSAAMDVSHDPTLAARMLDISASVLDGHYDRADQVAAARSYDKLITRLQAEAIARSAYQRHRPRLRDSGDPQ